MFQKAKVNDKVYSPKYGWGIITDTNFSLPSFPIAVQFNGETGLFSTDGKSLSTDVMPSIFWDVPVIPTAPPVLETIEVKHYLVFDCVIGEEPFFVASFTDRKSAEEFTASVGTYDYCEVSGEMNFYAKR